MVVGIKRTGETQSAYPNSPCFQKDLRTFCHSGAGGDDIIHNEDSFPFDLMGVWHGICAGQIDLSFCGTEGMLGRSGAILFEKLCIRDIQPFCQIFCKEVCLVITSFPLLFGMHGNTAEIIRLTQQDIVPQPFGSQGAKERS